MLYKGREVLATCHNGQRCEALSMIIACFLPTAFPLSSPIAKHQHMHVTGGRSYHAPCGGQYAGPVQRCHQSWLEGSHACVPCSVVSSPDLLVQTRVEGSGMKLHAVLVGV